MGVVFCTPLRQTFLTATTVYEVEVVTTTTVVTEALEPTQDTETLDSPQTTETLGSTQTTEAATTVPTSDSTTSSSSEISVPTGTVYSGRGTYYEVGSDNCGTSSTNEDFVCAIAKSLYDTAANSESISTYCGKYINANYNGKSVRVKVVDSCQSCTDNDLDFSPSAFQQLADLSIGVLQIDWSWDN
ncbi:DEKNAAC105571 [Brettanomyces naardenensis]|uniref:DEKNAAC105571 n=1 Tax=Brettanomyces naardenensis TaxID=13370 RepID=A0A448YTW8_BRENA|nr:DEKNAAC105571 [Brettanomyces naardenensis]